MTLSQSDQECLNDLQAGGSGRSKRLEQLIDKHRKLINETVWKHKLTREEAEDIFSETIAIFIEKIDKGDFRELSSISTYIQGIFNHVRADEFRKKDTIKRGGQMKRVYIIDENLSNGIPEIMRFYTDEDNKRMAHILLGMISEKCRKVLILSIFYEFDMDEIAHRTGIKNANAARTKKNTCLKQLKKILMENKGMTGIA